jgi:hypothetical protein
MTSSPQTEFEEMDVVSFHTRAIHAILLRPAVPNAKTAVCMVKLHYNMQREYQTIKRIISKNARGDKHCSLEGALMLPIFLEIMA